MTAGTTWATSLLSRLQDAALPLLSAGYATVHLRRSAAAVDDALDVLDAGKATLHLLVEVEAAADALAADAKRLRGVLAEVMAESGAPRFQTDYHMATVSEGRASVIITDPAAVPAELLTAPKPQPDKAKIMAALKVGEAVPGAALSNSPPILSIRVRT